MDRFIWLIFVLGFAAGALPYLIHAFLYLVAAVLSAAIVVGIVAGVFVLVGAGFSVLLGRGRNAFPAKRQESPRILNITPERRPRGGKRRDADD